MDELLTVLECSVCLDRLDDTSKVLPCQHTFHYACLESIVESTDELVCPECRLLVETEINDLPSNITIIRILEGIKHTNRSEAASLIESPHVDSPSTSDAVSPQLDLFEICEKTELHIAAETGDLETLKKLLHQGAEIHAKDEMGNTPLHCAAFTGMLNTVTELLMSGASVNSRNEFDETPLNLAEYELHYHLFDILLEYKTIKDLLSATANNETTTVDRLLMNGANVNTRFMSPSSLKGKTPLHITAEKGFISLLKDLVIHGAEINAIDNEGNTPLHYAVTNRMVDAVTELLDSNANINLKNNDGKTPLDVAKDLPPEIASIIIQKVQSVMQFSLALAVTESSLCTLQAEKKKEKLGDYAPEWVSNKSVTKCQRCDDEFTFTFRRHHCRACGLVICRNCSENKTFLNYKKGSAKVCDQCYLRLECQSFTDIFDDDDEIEAPTLIDTLTTLIQDQINKSNLCSELINETMDSIDEKDLCTYTESKENYVLQHWFYCNTCELVNNEGVCLVCAKVCHKDHDITYAKYSQFFCDCGASGSGSCKALTIRQREWSHVQNMPDVLQDDGFSNAEACTFLKSGKKFIRQHGFNCHTCSLTSQSGLGICRVCVKVCHHDHQVSYSCYGDLYCDCGESCCLELGMKRRQGIIPLLGSKDRDHFRRFKTIDGSLEFSVITYSILLLKSIVLIFFTKCLICGLFI